MTTTISQPAPLPAAETSWTVTDRCRIRGRLVGPGTQLSITGERGRFRFHRLVTRPDGVQWIDVIGGRRPTTRAAAAEQWRSFRPERVRTVHRARPDVRMGR